MIALGLSAPSGHDFPRRLRLSDEAAAHVRDLIVTGQLKGGEFIRPEAVADTLGISATPVREGLLQLQTEGLLQVAPRRGFIVSSLSPKDIRDGAQASALLGGELCARTASLGPPPTSRSCKTFRPGWSTPPKRAISPASKSSTPSFT